MNTIFNFKRAGLLIQCYFIERFHGELMFWIVSIIVMMFVRNIPPALWTFAIIACIFHTGLFFRELHSPTNRINYFMIPATQIEKFVVALFYTIVYFWVAMIMVYVVGNILGTWINNLLANSGLLSGILGFHHSDLKWIMFEPVGHKMGILIIQSIFILGGIYFKKNQVVLTFLALVIIGFILGVFGGLESKFLFGDIIKSSINGNGIQLSGDIFGDAIGYMKIIKNIFLYLLAPYLWLVSYIRLTEKEV